MSLSLTLEAGGEAAIVETDGDRVTLSSPRASPPGSTLEGTLDGETYRVKVRGCRQEGARYRILGRFVNLSRSQRARLMAQP